VCVSCLVFSKLLQRRRWSSISSVVILALGGTRSSGIAEGVDHGRRRCAWRWSIRSSARRRTGLVFEQGRSSCTEMFCGRSSVRIVHFVRLVFVERAGPEFSSMTADHELLQVGVWVTTDLNRL